MRTRERPYECNHSKKRFKQSAHLTTRDRTHTGEKAYKCDTFGKRLARFSHLVDHMQIHTGEKPYKCKVCGKAFAQSSHLAVHVRLHTQLHSEFSQEHDIFLRSVRTLCNSERAISCKASPSTACFLSRDGRNFFDDRQGSVPIGPASGQGNPLIVSFLNAVLLPTSCAYKCLHVHGSRSSWDERMPVYIPC